MHLDNPTPSCIPDRRVPTHPNLTTRQTSHLEWLSPQHPSRSPTAIISPTSDFRCNVMYVSERHVAFQPPAMTRIGGESKHVLRSSHLHEFVIAIGRGADPGGEIGFMHPVSHAVRVRVYYNSSAKQRSPQSLSTVACGLSTKQSLAEIPHPLQLVTSDTGRGRTSRTGIIMCRFLRFRYRKSVRNVLDTKKSTWSRNFPPGPFIGGIIGTHRS